MEYAKLLRRIANDLDDITLSDVTRVMDKLCEVAVAAFIDTDTIELGPLGTLSFQYIPPSSSERGELHYIGRIQFAVNKKVAKYIIENNVRMIKQEERE